MGPGDGLLVDPMLNYVPHKEGRRPRRRVPDKGAIGRRSLGREGGGGEEPWELLWRLIEEARMEGDRGRHSGKN